jgi:hypothetical protein
VEEATGMNSIKFCIKFVECGNGFPCPENVLEKRASTIYFAATR